MHILLISALPEVHGFFGLRHHYPIAATSPSGGSTGATPAESEPLGVATFTEVDPERRGAVADILRSASLPGPVVAHLTGTSPSILRTAEELRAVNVPFVYSPMIPSNPSMLDRFARRLTGLRSAPSKDIELAAKIAACAGRVIVDSAFAETCLRRSAGIPGVRILTVGGPEMTDPHGTGPGVRGGGSPPGGHGSSSDGSGSPAGVSGFGNLAVAFCDELAPEWNVMRFLFAMEKINADAIVVAGKSDTPCARECADRAGLNNRVKFLSWERGNARAIAREVAAAMERASIIVDPSARGLGGAIVKAFAGSGMPAVVSRSSVYGSPATDGLFTFEPSSWELLNHAVTRAFNRAAAGPSERVTVRAGGRNVETARILTQVYAQAAGA